MCKINQSNNDLNYLKPQCEKCFGLCCVALYFFKTDGFPKDKKSGVPCQHLDKNFRCAVHNELKPLGHKGCRTYECFGAGQQISRVTFNGRDWRREPSTAELMFGTFLIIQQLHEICWYLTESLSYPLTAQLNEKVKQALDETKSAVGLPPEALKTYDITAHHAEISSLLKDISTHVRKGMNVNIKPALKVNQVKNHADFFGKDLRNRDLRCADLRGACLIAANLENCDLSGADLLGADLRDANLKGTDLANSLFLTPLQINSARISQKTKLPDMINLLNRQ